MWTRRRVLDRLGAVWFRTAHPAAARRRVRLLLVLSHMRSRSTVLTHVLGSNPRVCGYAETHRSYLHPRDVTVLRARLHAEFGGPAEDTYLLDRLLHDDCRVSDAVLERFAPKALFLVRTPEAAIRSIVPLALEDGLPWTDGRSAAEYYRDRLATLASLAARIEPVDRKLVESDDLVANTAETLADLTRWLGLERPLQDHYEIFQHTGRPGYGDTSQHIRRGFLAPTPPRARVEVPPDLLVECEAAYRALRGMARGQGLSPPSDPDPVPDPDPDPASSSRPPGPASRAP